jgi:quercetin dioxygenase-like cupin family protein
MPRTTHVPAGEYPKSARVHRLDLDARAARLIAKLPGRGRQSETLAREGGVSVVLMVMEAGDALKEHSAPGVVTVHLLSGHVALTAGGEAMEMRPGELALLQGGVGHDLRAEEPSVVLLTVTGGGG